MSIGDWCLFKIGGRILIGLLHSFSFINGKTLKDKAFRQTCASLNSEKAVGVLGTWYNWNRDGQLLHEHVQEHEFVRITCYRGTITKPAYDKKVLTISKGLVQSIDDVVDEMWLYD